MANVYIGLGSNLGRPVEQITLALDGLDGLPATRLLKRSSLYVTKPVGPPNQPDFVNAVALIRTPLAPLVLLGHLHTLETRHGRLRIQKWGKRTLDLDILLYGSQVLRHPRLTVPHPLLHQRAFTLIPLQEIDPDLRIPGRGKVCTLCKRLTDTHAARL